MMAHPEGAEPEKMVKASKTSQSMGGFGKSILAAMIASVFMMTAFPDAAFAARSGGRVGGRAGFSSSRSAAPRSAPRASASRGPTVINKTYNRGPTVVYGGGGYGYGGYGGFGFSPFGFGGYGLYGGPFGYNPALSLGFTFAEVLIREN